MWKEPEAVGHSVFTVNPHREIKVSAQLAFFFVCTPGPRRWDGAAYIG